MKILVNNSSDAKFNDQRKDECEINDSWQALLCARDDPMKILQRNI